MIRKDDMLVVYVEEASQGCKLSVTATTAHSLDKVVINAEYGVYNLAELKEAITQAEAFLKQKQAAKEQAEREAQGITEVYT